MSAEIDSFLNTFEWHAILSYFNLAEMYSKILEILHLGTNQFIPKEPSISSKKPACHNKCPFNLKNKKKYHSTQNY